MNYRKIDNGRELSILVSLRPPHTTAIFSGVKKIEWRTRIMPFGRHFMYETKNDGGCGMVVGDYTCNVVYAFDSIFDIPQIFIDRGNVSRSFLESYSNGKKLYGHLITFPVEYKTPLHISAFNNFTAQYLANPGRLERPPQSWCYVGLPLYESLGSEVCI